MASQNNIYPLFFTLERVRNGYILTAKEETGGLKEAEYLPLIDMAVMSLLVNKAD